MSHKELEVLTKSERMALLIQYLADGEFHSGQALGAAMGVSRAAVWKYIQSLEDFGLFVDSIRGKGYRIAGGLSLLDAKRIESAFTAETKKVIGKIEVFKSINSTNQYLLEKVEAGDGAHGWVCLAEQQFAGRGRRGRVWVSPFAQNIYCSLLWRFEKGMQALEGLSLVVALSIVEALRSQQIPGLFLKWPNDILVEGKKLAGILLEVRGDLSDYSDVVIGFGVNVGMSARAGEKIDQQWIDVNSVAKQACDRNVLISAILNQLALDLKLFESEGFTIFQARWNALDGFKGKMVKIIAGKDQQIGIESGVNAQGALLLESSGVMKVFHGGELSLRSVDEALA